MWFSPIRTSSCARLGQILARHKRLNSFGIGNARVHGEYHDLDILIRRGTYPYTAGANPLKNLLPPWVQVGDNEPPAARAAPAGLSWFEPADTGRIIGFPCPGTDA
jgi:hypothetical protein